MSALVLAAGQPVYHRGRQQWGVFRGPHSPATSIVVFDDDPDEPVEVTTIMLVPADPDPSTDHAPAGTT